MGNLLIPEILEKYFIHLTALDVVCNAAGPLTLTDLLLSGQRSLSAGHFLLDKSKIEQIYTCHNLRHRANSQQAKHWLFILRFACKLQNVLEQSLSSLM